MGLPWAVLIAAAVFGVMAPTLAWVEFSNGVEKLNIATALEIRRGSPWLIPTLEGEPRVRKPPLTAWITAAAVRRETVAAMSSPDPAVRDAAHRQLAWQVRWPALLMSCLMLVAVYALGRTLLDARTGILAALIAGTTVYFARFTRQAITDIPLTLFVAAANVFLARAILDGKRYGGFILAGGLLGLAMMSKGPVALVQSVAPAAAFIVWRWRIGGARGPGGASRWLAPALGFAIMLGVGLAWFVYVVWQTPNIQQLWLKEVLRTDPVEKDTSDWWDYISIFPHLMPWLVFFLGGLIEGVRAFFGDCSWRKRIEPAGDGCAARARDGLVMALLLVLVPVIIMSCFRDRKDRYLLPLAGPAAILIAASVRAFIAMPKLGLIERLGGGLHWVFLLILAVGLPLLGARPWSADLAAADGQARLTLAIVAVSLGIGLVIFIGGILAQRRWRSAFVVTTALLMLGSQVLSIHGHTRSRQGRSDMKPLADQVWRDHPDAVCYNLRGTDGRRKMAQQDLSIYLNRITPVYETVEQIPAVAGHPQIYIELWEEGAPEPRPAPGWTFYTRVPRNPKEWWMAFIRMP